MIRRIRNRTSYPRLSLLPSGRLQPTMRTSCTKPTTVEAIKGKRPSAMRLPQAPRTPLPELAEFLAPLRVHVTQGPSAETLRQYLTGLISEPPNKHWPTLAGD